MSSMSPGLFTAREVLIEPTFDAWRETARNLFSAGTAPELVSILDTAAALSPPLFSNPDRQAASSSSQPIFVPRAFVECARIVACHRSPDRWNLLYRILWRLQQKRDLLKIDVDDDVVVFRKLEHQVKHDLHKMHAFVRFRRVLDESGEHYISWYEPAHLVLELAAPFFAERFAVMRWSILTPDGSVHWSPESKQLAFGPGVPRSAAPDGDDLEALWRTYYGSIYNPARTNLSAMRGHMAVRYWKNLPEIASLPQMLGEADARVEAMIERGSKATAKAFVPAEHALPVLQASIPRCQGCELYRCATQSVFGRGPERARMMLIGEQPGDEEDRRGEPFVGPAGRLLNELLSEAGIERKTVYVTNAVKHFKFTERGGRRLHESPRLHEIFACRPWLEAELEAVHPELVVCLGASAAKSLLGAKFALMRERGTLQRSEYAERVVATLHPSAILRASDSARAAEMRALLLCDLRVAQSLLG